MELLTTMRNVTLPVEQVYLEHVAVSGTQFLRISSQLVVSVPQNSTLSIVMPTANGVGNATVEGACTLFLDVYKANSRLDTTVLTNR